MIQVRIDEKRYGSLVVLQDLEFSLHPGERLAILGPSGVGKSTLLRLIGGLDDDYVGEVSIQPPHNTVKAMVFQEPTLLPWCSALDNLSAIHPTVPKAEARALLERVGLGNRLKHFPGQLSLGEQRRLALARAFLGKPSLLLMDEPFTSLDEDRVADMLALSDQLLSTATPPPSLIFVTHSRAEAEQLRCRLLSLG